MPPSVAEEAGATSHRAGGVLAIVVLAAGLPAFFLSLYVARGFGFPVGSDGPVYLWWARLAGTEGLSVIPTRPGVPLLTLVMGGTLGISQPEALAAAGVVLATAVGLGGAVLARAAHGAEAGAATVLLAGILAGTFAADMAGGYYANLVFAALFVAAAAVLAIERPRSALAAAGLLGAGGLAHPMFFPLGLVILALAATPARRRRTPGEPLLQTEFGRVGAAVAGGGLLLGAGLASLAIGPGSPGVDTSADAFRRRAGLLTELGRSYFDRFVRRSARFVLPVSVPLALAGLWGTSGFAGRVLRSWAGVILAGTAVALATGALPAARFLGFGVALPLLATLGLARLYRWVMARPRIPPARRRALAAGLTAALALAMTAGSAIPWRRQTPFLSPVEVARARAAGELAAASSDPGTPLVFVVDGEDPVTVPFLVARAANVIRASVPPGRIRDVYVYPGSAESYTAREPTLIGDTHYDALSRLYLGDIEKAAGRSGTTPLAFVLAPFDRPGFDAARELGTLERPGVLSLNPMRLHPADAGAGGGPLAPSSGWGIVLATASVLLFLGAAGFGWSRAVALDLPSALALAPAFGASATIIAGIALERLGVPLTGAPGPAAISALAAGGGYLVLLVQGNRRARAAA